MSAVPIRCALVWLTAALAATAQEEAPPPSIPMLVKFDEAALAQRPPEQRTLEALAEELRQAMALAAASLEETPLTGLLRGEAESHPDFSRWMLLRLRLEEAPLTQEKVAAAVSAVRGHSLVKHAEVDHDALGLPKATPPKPAAAEDALIPNDELYGQQYYHELIRTPWAWQITTGSPDITVAVLDTGCNTTIVAFQGRIAGGYDFVKNTPEVTDTNGHGTAIAALIAAPGNDGLDIAGMDWRCRLLPVNMAKGGTAVWAQAIEYAVAKGARVINISAKLDCLEPSPILEEALAGTVNRGVVIVASAGNDDQPQLAWPASSEHVISVGATDGLEHRWQDPLRGQGSNYGPGLDLVAPGASIVTIDLKAHRGVGEGTSPAAALVAGACSLLLAQDPSLTPQQVREILCASATKIGRPEDWTKGIHPEFGHGRLNVERAIKSLVRGEP